MTQAETAMRDALTAQARACRERGSPFTGLLCDLLGHLLSRSTAVGRRVLDWSGRPDARGDSVPLRLTAGLHALVRRGQFPRLAALYPPYPYPLPGHETLEPALAEALPAADADVLPWLDRPPQTNEPMRSARLMASLLVVAAETGGLPVALHEIGAGAGLLLMLDRYEHRLSGVTAGTPGAPVRIEPGWEGGVLPAPAPTSRQPIRPASTGRRRRVGQRRCSIWKWSGPGLYASLFMPWSCNMRRRRRPHGWRRMRRGSEPPRRHDRPSLGCPSRQTRIRANAPASG